MLPLVALVGVCALAAGFLGASRAGRGMAVTAGVLGGTYLAWTVATRRTWESTVRRAAYVAAHPRGVDLDRAVDAALGASLLAVALGCWVLAGDRAPAWPVRVAGGCVAVLTVAALGWAVAAGG